jgi:hypothetical protein
MKPTDADYPEEEEEEQQPRRRPAFPTISRPSFSLGSFDEPSPFSFPLDTPSLSRAKDLMMSGMESNREQWEDCHLSFVTYMGKLNTLMKGSAS